MGRINVAGDGARRDGIVRAAERMANSILNRCLSLSALSSSRSLWAG